MNKLLTKIITKENKEKNIVCEADFLVAFMDDKINYKMSIEIFTIYMYNKLY